MCTACDLMLSRNKLESQQKPKIGIDIKEAEEIMANCGHRGCYFFIWKRPNWGGQAVAAARQLHTVQWLTQKGNAPCHTIKTAKEISKDNAWELDTSTLTALQCFQIGPITGVFVWCLPLGHPMSPARWGLHGSCLYLILIHDQIGILGIGRPGWWHGLFVTCHSWPVLIHKHIKYSILSSGHRLLSLTL